MKRIRVFLWALVIVAAIGLAALYFTHGRPSGQSASETSMSSLGGQFALTSADGQPFSSKSLAGKPYVIFFGFTNCPDVCPTTLARLVRLRQQFGSNDSYSIVFVSVDPERDSPQQMLDYVRLFDAPIIALTGTSAQIAQVKKQFGIFSQKVAGENGSYTVDHSATALLFDREGKFQSTIAADEGDSAALDKLRRLTNNS